jgi:hypothetical protein
VFTRERFDPREEIRAIFGRAQNGTQGTRPDAHRGHAMPDGLVQSRASQNLSVIVRMGIQKPWHYPTPFGINHLVELRFINLVCKLMNPARLDDDIGPETGFTRSVEN